MTGRPWAAPPAVCADGGAHRAGDDPSDKMTGATAPVLVASAPPPTGRDRYDWELAGSCPDRASDGARKE